MLQKLYIKNFAIINEIQLEFQKGLSIITGETGAGKSILLGALELILGQRADHTVVLNPSEKCIVEAQFQTNENALINQYLQQNDFEVFHDIIIRREINANGRSRAFINDSPARLEDLATISQYLVDLHRQFDNYDLLQKNEQLAIIDDYLSLNKERENFQQQYQQLLRVQQELQEKSLAAKNAKAEQDYLQFIFEEIDALQLRGNEIEEWEQELSILENAQEIKDILLQGADLLRHNEQAILDKLQILAKRIKQYAHLSSELGDLDNRLNSSIEELKDISTELEIQESKLNTDDERIFYLREKLELANKLLLKHQLSDTQGLIAFGEEISNKLFAITTIDSNIEELQNQHSLLKNTCASSSQQLSKKRLEGIKIFSAAVNEMLPEVGLINSKFDIQHAYKNMSANGIDEIHFLFDANNTGKLQAMQKAVSGGEMSRIMLIIKSLLAHVAALPCMIFDEIDTGISGETALKVGKVLQKLAKNHQVISITHLPQIAAQANQHYFVYKEKVHEKDAQQTNIKILGDAERVQVISAMLSGKQESEKFTAAAEELLGL